MRDTITTDVVTRINLYQTFLDRFKHPYAVIHRADLHTALLDACKEYPAFITLKTSQKVTDIEDKGHSVTVRTETGEAYEGQALVGADGLWSIVRQKISMEEQSAKKKIIEITDNGVKRRVAG